MQKMKKERKYKCRLHEITKKQNCVNGVDFLQLLKTIEHITFYITTRESTD